MGFNFSNAISSLNDAMAPAPNKATPSLLGAFGGESTGFAKGVSELYSQGFYQNGALPDAFTVAKGMENNEIPKSIANSYALFNYQGFSGGFTNQSRAVNRCDDYEIKTKNRGKSKKSKISSNCKGLRLCSLD